MLQAIVHFSLRFRGIVVSLACLLIGYGLFVASRAKLDVFPEFVPPQVPPFDIRRCVANHAFGGGGASPRSRPLFYGNKM